jgi:hypothetical protein
MAIDVNFFEAGVFADAVIDVGNEIAGLEFVKHPDVEGHFFGVALFEAIPVESFEDLVVGIAGNFQIGVEEAFMDGAGNGVEFYIGVEVFEDGVETINLFGIIGKEVVGDTLSGILLKIVDEEIELFVESGLRLGVIGNNCVIVEGSGFIAQQDEGECPDVVGDAFGVEEGLVAEKDSQIAFIEARDGGGELGGFIVKKPEMVFDLEGIPDPEDGIGG